MPFLSLCPPSLSCCYNLISIPRTPPHIPSAWTHPAAWRLSLPLWPRIGNRQCHGMRGPHDPHDPLGHSVKSWNHVSLQRVHLLPLLCRHLRPQGHRPNVFTQNDRDDHSETKLETRNSRKEKKLMDEGYKESFFSLFLLDSTCNTRLCSLTRCVDHDVLAS